MLTVSNEVYNDLKKNSVIDFNSDYSWFYPHQAVAIYNVFPIINQCSFCNGSGEGTDSTYCDKCNGVGSIKTVGLDTVSNGKVTLFTSPMPKKFLPSFPKDCVVSKPRLCRGLP
jgi:hypothetical protein